MKAYYNEHDRFAAAWLRELIKAKLIADGDVDERDIQEVKGSDLDGYTQVHFFAGIGGWSYALRLAGWPDDRPVWTGSCPCQPFSDAGEGGDVADPRHLWPDFRRLIAERSPTDCFGEQVASSRGCRWLKGVFGDLEALEYRVAGADLSGVVAGAMHIRRRLYWVANSVREGRTGHRQDARVPCGTTAALSESLDSAPDAWSIVAGDFSRVRNDDGVSLAVARCRAKGYGNAIVPQVAARFIQASIEAINEQGAKQ